ncbi:MAG: ATP-binding protein [Candidatus Binatia bacterium]
MTDALAQYLEEHAERIVERWCAEVRRDPMQPANRLKLQGAALYDHLPSLLRMLATCLRGGSSENVEKEGAEHGHQRRQHGYTVAELLWEMTLFRRVLMAVIEREFQKTAHPLSADDLAAARLCVLDLLDRSVHASVSQFMREAEGERDEARTRAADATARLQQVNARLEEAHVQKDRFLSILSHELRNPLAPILNTVHVLQRLDHGRADVSTHYALIERQARHMSRLVDDLLDLNRIAYGKLELRSQVVSVQAAIAFAVEGSRAAFDEKGVELRVDIAEQPLAVFADSTRLSQIAMNLLNNAVKYTPRSGSTVLSVRAQGSEVVISIRDTGAGIAPGMLKRIFEPFEQADTTLAHSRGGLGLGLMIARGLVKAQGGEIEAHSAGPGRGSEFIVRLPISLSEPADAVSGVGPKTDSVTPRRIAVVEDNEDAREALATALRLAGHEVFLAGNAAQAREIARTEAPDTFILDIGLPDTDGYALAEELRENRAGKGARLIAITGYGSQMDRERARAAGFDHHLTKPVEVAQLTALLSD